jgi:glycosyltransferase involved in cell wall biosynthesis
MPQAAIMSKLTSNQSCVVILIAPNVSEQMGGEAIKALHIFRHFAAIDPETIQITHERNERELTHRLALQNVEYVRDTWFAKLLWRSVVLRWFLNAWFSWKAVKLAESIAQRPEMHGKRCVLHQTEPNSPVLPRATSDLHPNVFGPINGNIYYPPEFQRFESWFARLRRVLHFPAQCLHRIFFSGLRRADLILVAGGDRTRRSLLAAGVRPEKMLDTVDCGVKDEMLDRPRPTHSGVNRRFIHFGRLVFHKGTALAIRAIAKSTSGACLDIVGAGPELENCKKLAVDLNLGDRVRFLPWYTRHEELFASFASYRGMLLPTLEDANGIVVQEAMALGLPAICLDWGGPQLLIQHGETGFLIRTGHPDAVVKGLAVAIDQLTTNGALAEKMSANARARAECWRWSTVAATWLQTVKSAGQRDR